MSFGFRIPSRVPHRIYVLYFLLWSMLIASALVFPFFFFFPHKISCPSVLFLGCSPHRQKTGAVNFGECRRSKVPFSSHHIRASLLTEWPATGDANFVHLVKVVSARTSHCEDAIFPFLDSFFGSDSKVSPYSRLEKELNFIFWKSEYIHILLWIL